MDESARLARLAGLAVLGTPPEPLFDSLTRIAAAQCEVPMAAIGLIDAERQWFMAQVGFDGVPSTPRALAFCEHALLDPTGGQVMEVPDAAEDPRFAAHPQVNGPPHIRYYASVLLVMPGGEAVGTLCVADRRPRRLNDLQRHLLLDLADAAVQGLLLRERARHRAGPARRAGALDGLFEEGAARENAHLQASVAALVAHSQDAIYTGDREGRILSWNRGAEQLYGYSEAEVLGRDPMLLAAEADRAPLWALRQRLFDTGEMPVIEGPRLRKDGSRVWVSVNAYRLPEVAGNPTRYIVVQRDITPLKAAEAAVRESEQRFRVLTEASPLGVFHTGRDGGCTYVNEAWCRIYGMAADAALGHGWTHGLHPDDAGPVAETWREAAARGVPFSMRYRARRPDGEVRSVHARANAVRAADGSVSGFVGVVEDITERELAQAALESSRRSLRQLYEATPAMLHSCDEQGRLLSVSDTWLEKIGYQRSEVIGRPQGDFMAEPSRRFIAETAWPQLLRHGRVANVPLRLTPRSGEDMLVVMSARFEPPGLLGPRPGPAARPLRVLAVMEDVTVSLRHSTELQREQMLRAEVERRAEELAALLRERSEMLDVLAHEVRQPLNNASAALQSAQAVLGANDAGVAARLERAAQVLATVRGGIDNTLAAAALLASDEPLAVEDADVDLLVALTVGDLDPAELARVQLRREGSTRTAAMDVSLMRLALRNLLVNALRYSPAGTPVTVTIADSDEPLALVLEVRDQGGGFEASFVPRMFQRGTRGQAAVGRRFAGGTGLGLYIVHRILQMHGGSVVLAHNEPGDVRMRLLLPPARDE